MADPLLTLLAFFTLLLPLIYTWRPGSKVNATRVGKTPGILGLNLIAAKREFALYGHSLVERGYRKFPDANFIVQTQDMERLVIAPKFLAELRMLPESQLSHSAALVEKHLGHYSGVDTILESHQHSDVCRIQLTQNLPRLLPAMADELDFAMPQFLSECTTESFVPVPTYGFTFSMVLSVSSRVFVGDLLSRDQDWLQVVSAYLAEVVSTAKALRPYPRMIRPILRPVLAPKARMTAILSKAQKVLIPAINTRRHSHDKHVDLLQFLVDTSENEQYLPIILKLLVLISAALHTSTMAAVNALYDMCARPEYIKALRDEAQATILSDRGSWQMSTIKRLKQLDSFCKESLRFTQPDTLGFNRKTISPVRLSDGFTTLPPGLCINMPAGPMSRDPAFYDNPDVFDGHRFYRAGREGAQPPEHDFTGIEKGNVVWGNGRLTCPGRWYASAMNKLIIATLLTRYDFRFPDGQITRPPSIYSDGAIIPSPTQEIVIRKYQ